MATKLPDGLELAAFLEREDIRDAFVSLTAKSLRRTAAGRPLGSSSLRRAAQMLRARPDLDIVPFRGNVDTRLASSPTASPTPRCSPSPGSTGWAGRAR